LDEINKSLEEFLNQWNYHGSSTERGLSPLQLWTEGILRNAYNRFNPLDTLLTEDELESYGVDPEGGIESPTESDNECVIPQIDVALNDEQSLVSNLDMNMKIMYLL